MITVPEEETSSYNNTLSQKKILTIIDSFHAGGKERRLLELLKGLTARHVDCELIVMSEVVTYPELYALDIPIHFVTRKYKKDPTVIGNLYRIIRQANPDIVQSWSSMTSVYVFSITRWLNIPFVNAIIADAPRHVKPLSQRWLRRKLTFPFSDAIVGNSQAGLKAYQAPAQKSHVMYNGFDFKRIDQVRPTEEVRQELGITTEKVVGMVGKFQVRKDYRTYLEAARQMVKERVDVTFLAVGDGEMQESYEQMFAGAAQNRILFTGRRSDVESVVNLFDVGVLTTNHLVHGEGISNSLMEYMVLGKPVIATEGGGTAELVTHGEVGYIVPSGNVAALVDKLRLLLDDAPRAQEMGQRGKERIREHFNLDRMTEEYIQLYQNLLASN